jgi:hypothetical protein
MSITGYSISKGKTYFNVYLNTFENNSFTGSNYNAKFIVNARGNLDVSDFSKSYNVYFSLQSVATSTLDILTGIEPAECYVAHVDIGSNKINNVSYSDTSSPMFIMNQSQLTYGAQPFTRFDTKYQDNPPIFVNTLYGLDTIGINVFLVAGATCPSTTDYQAVLRFEEV